MTGAAELHAPTLTAQGRYFAALGRCERTGDHASAARLRAAGPPPPQPGDGITGALAYHRHRADQGDHKAALFVRRLTLSAATPARG
jgi:hypothetical protein